MYRGGGGIARDNEYGYSKDFQCPPLAQFKLTTTSSSDGKTVGRRPADDVTDMAFLRHKFRVRYVTLRVTLRYNLYSSINFLSISELVHLFIAHTHTYRVI